MTRLMCSRNRSEVESVKKELFKAGISSEIRSNPLADALRVTRIELWVQNERDFFKASKLYGAMHLSGTASAVGAAGVQETKSAESFIEVAEPRATQLNPENNRFGSRSSAEPRRNDLEQASSLLEQEIEEMLERQKALASTCSSLRAKVTSLTAEVSRTQESLESERQARAALQKDQAEEISGLRAAVERENRERKRAEEQRDHDRREWELKLRSCDEALSESHKKLEAKNLQLQSQQAAVVELRKEIVSGESRYQEQQKALSKAAAELALEREAKIAAQEKAERATAAQASLEKELAQQKDLQQQMDGYLSKLNSLRTKMQANRAADPDWEA